MDASLGELAVFVSGRTPEVWWPPESEDPPSKAFLATQRRWGDPEFVPDVVPQMAGEADIIVLRATGGGLQFSYGVPGLSAHTVLEALEIEDLLVGPRCPQQRYLACSGPEPGEALWGGGRLGGLCRSVGPFFCDGRGPATLREPL